MANHPLRHASLRSAATAGVLAVALLGAAPYAHADGTAAQPPAPPQGAASAAHKAASRSTTLHALSRFFAHDKAVTAAKADPRIEGRSVPVYTLSREFVAAPSAARATTLPVAELKLFATRAVSSDGQRASVMAARTTKGWQVVNIATGDDETRYAAKGAAKAPDGTVFEEPQIDAWYVQDGKRVLPLDPDARKAVGSKGMTLRAYHARVHDAYGDKLPGSGYDKKGLAGGFGQQEEKARKAAATATHTSAGAHSPADALVPVGASAAVIAAAATGTWLVRRRSNQPMRRRIGS
ncbi:hypothetical protein [Streptomyces sp. 891-h]|uniref:hypothetical protein n=1 Tax=Streptomyces sp. 891-h TaxID=2720714 RepID=UPI001FAAA6C7|nr:hypothetical protein [Streptomyces sp. 891-h]UNZ15930.1 hypothetical protein HC362_01300 [Streptomyces sp. 891-h]